MLFKLFRDGLPVNTELSSMREKNQTYKCDWLVNSPASICIGTKISPRKTSLQGPTTSKGTRNEKVDYVTSVINHIGVRYKLHLAIGHELSSLLCSSTWGSSLSLFAIKGHPSSLSLRSLSVIRLLLRSVSRLLFNSLILRGISSPVEVLVKERLPNRFFTIFLSSKLQNQSLKSATGK